MNAMTSLGGAKAAVIRHRSHRLHIDTVLLTGDLVSSERPGKCSGFCGGTWKVFGEYAYSKLTDL